MKYTLFDIMRKLEKHRIHFIIQRMREDSIMITVTLVGERIEIDVFEDGHIEFSRFLGSEEALTNLELLNGILESAD